LAETAAGKIIVIPIHTLAALISRPSPRIANASGWREARIPRDLLSGSSSNILNAPDHR
jgi:hypothetical protein